VGGGGGGTSGDEVPVLTGLKIGLVVTVAFRLRAVRLSWLAAFTVIVPKPDAVFEVVM
jgi:hypothetical protein